MNRLFAFVVAGYHWYQCRRVLLHGDAIPRRSDTGRRRLLPICFPRAVCASDLLQRLSSCLGDPCCTDTANVAFRSFLRAWCVYVTDCHRVDIRCCFRADIATRTQPDLGARCLCNCDIGVALNLYELFVQNNIWSVAPGRSAGFYINPNVSGEALVGYGTGVPVGSLRQIQCRRSDVICPRSAWGICDV